MVTDILKAPPHTHVLTQGFWKSEALGTNPTARPPNIPQIQMSVNCFQCVPEQPDRK